MVDGKPHLKCPAQTCGYVFWDNPIPVVAAIVELQGNVILVRNKDWPPKLYGLVTGFLEKDETPEEGVLREVREELGLVGQVASFIGFYVFSEKNQLILAFHVRAAGEIVLGEELAEVRLILPERLRPWSFGTGPAVRDWLERSKVANGKGSLSSLDQAPS